jgi:hypothetical protein
MQIAAAIPADPFCADRARADIETTTTTALDADRAVHVGKVQARGHPTGQRPPVGHRRAAGHRGPHPDRRPSRHHRPANTGARPGRPVLRAGRRTGRRADPHHPEPGRRRAAADRADRPGRRREAITLGAAAWTAAGYDVLGLAPQRGPPPNSPPRQPATPTPSPNGHEQTGREDWRPGARTVLLVDEAGMLATTDSTPSPKPPCREMGSSS